MTWVRICIESLLPPSMRPGPGLDEMVADQHPVSDWLPIDVGYATKFRLKREKPINSLGLMYGWQIKEDTKVLDVSDSVAEWKAAKSMADVERIIARQNAEKEARFAAIVAAVDEYLARFPHLLYRVAHGMDRMEAR